jgi:hypothetical protein
VRFGTCPPRLVRRGGRGGRGLAVDQRPGAIYRHHGLTPAAGQGGAGGRWNPASGFWSLDFSTLQLGVFMTTTVYNNAERYPFESAGDPGLSISGAGRGCNTLTGRYEVEDLTVTGGNVTSFTASFEQHCEGGSAALRGCVHVGP